MSGIGNDFDPGDPKFSAQSEFTRPSVTFGRETLWPYTRGTRMLMAQICGDEDTLIYRALAHVFIHLRRTEKSALEDLAKHVVPLAWNLNAFRAAVVAFRADLDEEKAEALEFLAIEIYKEAVESDERTRAQVMPVRGRGGVKKKETTRATRRGRPQRSRASSASRGKK